MTSQLAAPSFDFRALLAYLPEHYRELSREFRILTMRKAPTGAKLTDVDQVLRVVFHYVGLDTSLRLTGAAAAGTEGQEVSLPRLSAPAVQKWVAKCGPFLGQLVAHMTEAEQQFAPSQWAGYSLVMADGTVVSRPGSKGTDARVHYALRLSDLGYIHAEVTDAHEGERLGRFPVEPGQLWGVDRNFANPPALMYILEQHADVLARYNTGTMPLFNARGEALEVRTFTRALQKKKVGTEAEHSVWVHPHGHEPIRVRLLIRKLDTLGRQRALERLREEHGQHIPENLRELSGYLLLITTVPKKRLSARKLLRLYRLRWQVELAIKGDKSLGGLSNLPTVREDTTYGWLCAKMLLALLVRKMARGEQPLSPPEQSDEAAAAA